MNKKLLAKKITVTPELAAKRIRRYLNLITDIDELRTINAILRTRFSAAQDSITQKAITAGIIATGKRVSFDVNPRKGMPARTVTGVVLKVNAKTVKVREDGSSMTWRVSPGLLRSAAKRVA